MSLTVQVSVSKKGVVVSNHDGSVSFDTFNQTGNYIAEMSWRQYGDDHAIAKIAIYDNYERKQALTDWITANPVREVIVGDTSVLVSLRLKF